jgi:two-component system sensor kinase FixL
MNAEATSPHAELEERLRFETLIAELSTKFINLPAGEVDREIMDAERRICELLRFDFATLWQGSDEAPGSFALTHFYSAQAGPQLPERMNQDQYPWAAQQLLAGRVIKVSSPDELPAEAARDRETLRQFGIKSNLALPLSVGGALPVGILGLGTMLVERDWPDALAQRLQLVAQIFANALARKRADEAFRVSEARLAAGTELAGLGYYEIDYAERTCFLDDRFREICGIPAEMARSFQAVEFWLQHVHADDLQLISQERQKLHDGSLDRIALEYRYQHPGRGQRWLHHSARVAGRRGGAGIRTFGVIREITHQKQAELEARELRKELAHADRVTLLGQLASALAHELSQPLGAILRNAEAAEIMLRETAPDLEELRAIITDILRDDQRAGQVIDRLRSLLKRRSLDLHPIDLPGVIAEVLSLVHADAATRHVRLDYVAGPGLPMIRGDRIHLQQVLLNLFINAMDAMEECTSGQRCIQVYAQLTGPVTVEVRICDNGPGVPAESLDKLFDPFFTTKANGMGMGLAVSKTIVEAHQGKLWVENRPEGGACFCFTLSVTEGASKQRTSDQ